MKFIIATGGTGGHLFPAIRVAEIMKSDGHDVLFFGSFERGIAQVSSSGFMYKELGARGLSGRSVIQMVLAIGPMIVAIVRAWKGIRQYKPDAVIGFGGYGAFPAVFVAVLLGVPALIHEQNVVPGRANRVLGKIVRKIAVSFRETETYFNGTKTVVTGYPCRILKRKLEREDVIRSFQLSEDRITILVFGGSQGSHTINTVFMETLPLIKEKMDVQVVHLSGPADYPDLLNRYNQSGIPFALYDFFDKMEEVYCAADCVVGRAGAGTVSELIYFNRPAVLIPYPYAQDHQKANIDMLCKHHNALCLEEKDLTPEKLSEAVCTVLAQKGLFTVQDDLTMADSARKISEAAYGII